MPMKYYRTLRAAIFLVALGCMCVGQAANAAADDGTESSMKHQILQQREDRLIVELPNRLVIIAQEIRTAPVVSAQVWVKTGSIYEQQHVGAGLSHYLEHLLAAGSTTTRTEEQTTQIIGEIGARTNAGTGLDTVNYYLDTTSDHTDTIIELLSDWMINSQINEAEVRREQEVIQREFESGRGSPRRIFWKLTQQARFRAHPARHPTIGYIDEFLNVTRDQIYDFYKRMYVPNNMVFVVAGDIDKQHVVDKIASIWADVPSRTMPKLFLPIEQPSEQPRSLTGYADMRGPKLRLAWPGTKLGAKHDFSLDLLGMALGQGESSRLVRVVRDQKHAVDSIDSYNVSFSWGEGFFGVDADIRRLPAEQAAGLSGEQATAMAVEQATALILEQVAKVRLEGITKDELARAKRKIIVNALNAGQTAHGVASRTASDLIHMGDPDYLQYYAKAIQQISIGQIMAAADRYLDPSRMITITLMPTPPNHQSKPLTRPEDDVDVRDLDVSPVVLDNAAMVDQMMAIHRKEGVFTAAVDIDPIERFQTVGGLRLLIQRSTLVPSVSIQMYSLGGLLGDQPGHEGLAAATARMAMKGTTTRTAQQIAQEIEDMGAALGSNIGNNSSYIRAQCLKEDWRAVLELFADVALHPTFPEDEWSKLKPRMVASVERLQDSWGGELGVAFRDAYFTDAHPWSQTTRGRAEVIDSLTSQDLRDYHASRFGASQTVLAIFGDVDPVAVAMAVEVLFKDMPAKPKVIFDPPLPPAPVEGIRQILTSKPLAAVQIGYGPGATRRSPDYPVLRVLTRVLSSFPSGWLEAQLRGSAGDGLVYGVWSYPMTGLVPGCLVIGFNTSPPQIGEAIKRTNAVVQRARETKVDDRTLARAKASVLVSVLLDQQSNADRATTAALDDLYGLGVDASEQFIEEVRSMTAEQLQFAAKMYLRNPVTVVLTNEPMQAPPESQPAGNANAD